MVHLEHGYQRVIYNLDEGGLDISVNSYVSKETFDSEYGYLEQKIYNFIPSVEDTSSNFIKQGYEYLKTLDEYADLVDC